MSRYWAAIFCQSFLTLASRALGAWATASYALAKYSSLVVTTAPRLFDTQPKISVCVSSGTRAHTLLDRIMRADSGTANVV